MSIDPSSEELCRAGIANLKRALDQFKSAGAKRTVARIRDCINSAEASLHHAERKHDRTKDHPPIDPATAAAKLAALGRVNPARRA